MGNNYLATLQIIIQPLLGCIFIDLAKLISALCTGSKANWVLQVLIINAQT